jgi:hypothetical protein
MAEADQSLVEGSQCGDGFIVLTARDEWSWIDSWESVIIVWMRDCQATLEGSDMIIWIHSQSRLFVSGNNRSSLLLLGLKWYVFHIQCIVSLIFWKIVHGFGSLSRVSSNRCAMQRISIRSDLNLATTAFRWPQLTEAPSAQNPTRLSLQLSTTTTTTACCLGKMLRVWNTNTVNYGGVHGSVHTVQSAQCPLSFLWVYRHSRRPTVVCVNL